MAIERSTVVGVFHERDMAERAIDGLHEAGFRDDQIGFVLRDGDTGSGEIGEAGSHAGGGAVGAAAGGVLGALMGMGIPEEEARYYEGEMQAGRVLVTVRAEGRIDEAHDIMRRFGSYDMDDLGREYSPVTARSSDPSLMDTPPERMERSQAALREEQRRVSEATRAAARESNFAEHSPAESTGRTVRPRWAEVSDIYHQRWQSKYGTSGRHWEDDERGYRFAYEMAEDPRFEERDFTQMEPELRMAYDDWSEKAGYDSRESPWDRMREPALEAWNDVRGGRRAA